MTELSPPMLRPAKFSDIFTVFRPRGGRIVGQFKAGDKLVHGYAHAELIRHETTPLASWEVAPSQQTLDAISKHMIRVDGDAIYFSLIENSDGTVSIRAMYNQILGSRLIATVPSKWVRQSRSDVGKRRANAKPI